MVEVGARSAIPPLVRNSYSSGVKGTQSIGALAIDPIDHNIIYAGTGNPNVACGGCSNRPALGVFRSNDGGSSWHPTGLNLDLASGDNAIMSFSTVYKLIVRKGGTKFNVTFPNIVIAATDLGLFQYADGSDTWKRISGGDLPAPGFPYRVTDLVQSSSRIYAAVPFSGIFREKPGGQLQFELLGPKNGLRRGVATDLGTGITISVGRIALAISRSNDQVLYAGFEIMHTKDGVDLAFDPIPPDDRIPHFYEIYKTVNGGETWDPLPMVPCGGPSLCEPGMREDDPQLDFNNVIAVDPNDPNSVYVGLIWLWRATDGGNSGQWENIAFPFVHVDVHAIAFDPGDSRVLYVANDGGVHRGTLDAEGGSAWQLSTANVALGQSVSVGQAPFNFNSVISGLWNNGYAMTTDRGQTWISVGGCDGGRATIDAEPVTGITIAYTNDCNSSRIRRNELRPEGVNQEKIWSGDTLGFWSNPYIGGEMLRESAGALFLTELANRRDASNLDMDSTWLPINPIGKTGNTTTMAFSRPNSIQQAYWVGTETGQVWYGLADLVSATLPFVLWELTACSNSSGMVNKVNKIAPDPRNPSRAFAVFDKTAGPGRVRACIRSGRNDWSGEAIDDSFIPEVLVEHVTSIVVDPSVKNTVYIGTDQGIYKGVQEGGRDIQSQDELPPLPSSGGWQWTRSPGISHVWVSDLAIHNSVDGPSGVIWAGSYGRGVYTRGWFTHITVPAALSVQAVQIGTVGKGENLPSVVAKVRLSAAGASKSAETPFYRNFARGSEITLQAPLQIQVGSGSQIQGGTASGISGGGETWQFVGWDISGYSSGTPSATELNGHIEPPVTREHREPTISLNLTGQTTAIAKYERMGPRVKTLHVQALLAGIEGAPDPLQVKITATSPNKTGGLASPFEITAPPNGQVVLTAPTAIVSDARNLQFFGWVISGQQVGSEATLSLKLDDNKTVSAIFRQVTIPLR